MDDLRQSANGLSEFNFFTDIYIRQSVSGPLDRTAGAERTRSFQRSAVGL
jgi:hypothetical protein